MLNSEQIRAARALLGWSGRQLAEESGVHLTTVQRLERGNGLASGTVKILVRIEGALEDAGVEFTSQNGGLGVYLKTHAEGR